MSEVGRVERKGRREIEAQVECLAREVLASRDDGLSLDRVEFTRQGRRWVLRVILDHPRGVTLDHCQEVSQVLGEALDRVDPIPHSYELEVSSPGVERPLVKDADYERFSGRLCTLHLFRPVDGKRTITGELGGLGPDGEVIVRPRSGGELRIPREAVAKAHLAIDWHRALGARGAPETDAGEDE